MLKPTVRRSAAVLLALLLVTLPLPGQNIDFTKGKSHIPFVFAPYTPMSVPRPQLINSPRIENLIRDGKLYLSLQDAIYLALENNLDIAVARYGPDIAETDILRARGGAISRGVGGVGTAAALGVGALAQLDPSVTVDFLWQRTDFPVNNPLTAGVGTVPAFGNVIRNLTQANFTYQQGFVTGTSFQIAWNNNRSSSTSFANFFNPAVNANVRFGFSQSLLNGFGYAQNKRFILVSKNSKEISDQAFLQQVMDSISTVKNAYWELVFAREDVKVKEQSLALAEKLYNDNKRQVEIGTLAPIEVVRAESEVARTRQDLIVSQTNLLQQQTTMKDLIAKNPMDLLLALVEIIPTEPVEVPDVPEVIPVQDAIQIAMEKRPEIAQGQFDLKNRNLTVKAVKNALLPRVDLFAFYAGAGLAGVGGLPVRDPNTGEFVGRTNIDPATGLPLEESGLARTLTRAFQGDFPDYGFGLTINIPIKNRAAQADMARAQLEERQSQTRYQRAVNTVIVDVRNTQIALEQNRARIEAAEKSRLLFEETLDAEQKKFQLGASTIFQVIQAQRDLAAARSVEVRARVDFKRAQVAFDRALGRTLERSNVTIDDALTGVVTGAPPKTEVRP